MRHVQVSLCGCKFPFYSTPTARNGFRAEFRIDITIREERTNSEDGKVKWKRGEGKTVGRSVLQPKIRAGQAEIAISEFYCQTNSPFNSSESNRKDDYKQMIGIRGERVRESEGEM